MRTIMIEDEEERHLIDFIFITSDGRIENFFPFEDVLSKFNKTFIENQFELSEIWHSKVRKIGSRLGNK